MPGMQLGRQSFELGQRVVSVSEASKAPLGAKGTVIGKEPDLLEILFDRTFAVGTDLDGR